MSGETPMSIFAIRVRKILQGNETEKRSMSQFKSPPYSLILAEILPPKKAPIASHTTHDPIMIPMENSFPEKMMSVSLSRIVCATIPLKPVMRTAKMK